MPAKIAGYIGNNPDDEYYFNEKSFLEPRDINRNDRFIQYGLVAAEMAIEDAGLKDITEEDKLSIGVSVGSGIGGLETIYEGSLTINNKEPRKLSSFYTISLVNLLSGQISIRYGFMDQTIQLHRLQQTHSIGDSGELIKRGAANVMIAGGSEAAVCKLGIAGFCAARSLVHHLMIRQMRHLDHGIKTEMVLWWEEQELLFLKKYMQKRGAQIYAELIGYGMSEMRII